MGNLGVDVGTNRLVVGRIDESGEAVFKSERDAFYRVVPKSAVNYNAIEMTLKKNGVSYVVDDGNFCIIGEEALQMALDRNDVSSRPMQRGVLSPKDKANLPMLKLLLKNLIGEEGNGDKLVYSVPGAPIDSTFDIEYHSTILNMFFDELGYKASPINEAFAIGLNELIDTGLTGVVASFGAGMQNIAVIAQGDPVITFSSIKSGDFIDHQVGQALDLSPSLVQLEKEAGVDLFNPTNKIMEAVSVYYRSVINYAVKNIVYELNNKKNSIPVFREPVPIVLSGGLAWAKGFKDMYEKELRKHEFPFDIGEVFVVSNPDHCVAAGCLLAAQL